MKKVTLKEVEIRLHERFGETVKIVPSTYVRTKIKAQFIDKEFGVFWCEPLYVMTRGYRHPNYRKVCKLIDIAEIKKRIFVAHGDSVKLDESTYLGTHFKARFIDTLHGEFWTLPKTLINGKHGHPARSLGKREETMIERYGVRNPQQNKEIADRTAKSSNNSCIKIHWKTGEELVCKASYEPKVIDYLNANKIEYSWQPRVFDTPILSLTGKNTVYTPDLLLIKTNMWIEIKGWMRKDAQEKWDWFQSEYPNSDLWNEKKLKEMGIL
jgi:hypothetical protein